MPERVAPAEAETRPGLARRDRLALGVQAWCARLAGPLSIPAIALAMRFIYGWRIRDLDAVRRRFRALRNEHRGPILLASNHLTYYDSPLIAWALMPAWRMVLRSGRVPWNVPERKNFAAKRWTRALAYVTKCLPIDRDGDRARAALVLAKLGHLLRRGEPVLMFPEGRRSRSGRVDRTNAAHGVGRLVKNVPGTGVLCIYLRGDGQREASVFAARGETFSVSMSWLEPHTEKRGLRGSLEITHQILDRLEAMEEAYHDGRQ